MAEVEGAQEITKHGLEEHPITISPSVCENQDVPNKEESGDLTINEEPFEISKAIEETMAMEVQLAQATGAEINVEEEQVTERNEVLGGKGDSGLKVRNENNESEENISVQTAMEPEETSLQADVELKTEQSDQDPCKEELSIDDRSIQDGQINLQESESQGYREEIEALTAMENIGLSTSVDGSMGENIQGCEDSQVQCIAEEGRSKTTGKAEAIPTGSGGATDILVKAGVEPDCQEVSDSTNETPTGVNNGDTQEECCKDAKHIAGQTELPVYSDADNGSMIASQDDGKSSEGDILVKETQGGPADTRVCYDEELSTEIKTGLKAPAEIDLKISENIDADLETQTKGVGKGQQTSAMGLEESRETCQVHAPTCLRNLPECLENSAENQGTRLDPLAEGTGEIPVSTADKLSGKMAEDAEEQQAISNNSARSQATEIVEKVEEHMPYLGNLIEASQAMESPSRSPGESAGVSNTGLEQQCKTGISESEDQDIP
ncbi:uncharacterized protein [Chiloscyllium punctatum]|uniref:Uncharacterized protein n=1 Tax=Chiloscyllium punctatum TaxID=137246 RepID=A0A401RMB0_CHIPU|nr:hypothetical protein [Chiloscyllium punctatum]